MQDIENIISKNIISKIIKDNVPEVDAKLCRQFEKITTINIDDWFLKNMNKITLSYSVNYIAHYKSINEKDIKSAFYQIKNTCKKLLETILIPDRDLLKADRFDLIGNPRYKDIYKNTLSLYTAWNMIDAEHNEPTLENNSLIFVGKNFNKSTFITILSSIIETSEKLSDSIASSNNRKRDPYIDHFLLSACDIEKCGKSKVVYKYFIPRLSLFCFKIDEFINFYKCKTGNT
ncbi:MAG: hypothetical protein RBS99_05960, partial [Rhodospirillales bacterium]|nr:hypothetical protein [Rhodospirillales bacterium]